MKIKKFLIICLSLICFCLPAFAELNIPAPYNYINDYAGIIDDKIEILLNEELQNIKFQQGIEISVLTVDSLQDYPMDMYANQTFRQWGIGNKENDSGILYLIAPFQRQSRIELGYGIEKILTDYETKTIQELGNPFFREEKYTYGIVHVLENLMLSIEGENYIPEYKKSIEENLIFAGIIWFTMIFIPMLFFINKKDASYKSSIITTQLFATPISFLTYSENIFWAFPLIYIIAVTTYYIHMAIKKGYIKPGNNIGSSSNNSGPFSGGSSSGSFGGFSGGSSGGGGSSNNW